MSEDVQPAANDTTADADGSLIEILRPDLERGLGDSLAIGEVQFCSMTRIR